MPDSGDNKQDTQGPSWQSKSEASTLENGAKVDDETTLVQAERFLEEESIRDEPDDKKVAFLQSKGIKHNQIQGLLQKHRNVAAASAVTSSKPESPPRSPRPTTSPAAAPPSPPQTDASYAQTRNSPPIITYPEFLTTSPHPSPLITKPRLLATLYIFSTLSFLLYGTSTYLVTPMIASLTNSRLSLLSTASANLTKLIAKLEELVSEVPTTTTGKTKMLEGGKYRDSDDDSDSDPTELFHRDIGVQTSLPSTPSSPKLLPVSVLDTQSSKLVELKGSIQSLLEDDSTFAQENQELDANIGIVKEFCDQMAYIPPAPMYGYSSYSTNSKTEDKNDEIAKVKAAIRGVKGVLLSARSFPGGVRASAQ